MKRKYSFKSFMNNELVSHIKDYGEINVQNKVIEINISTYTFVIDKDYVKVNYSKPMNNTFVFDKKRATQTMYQTQYGMISFEVHTSNIEFDGSELIIEYSLYQMGEKQADYKIILKSL
jgi:predicted aspartyl protease